MLNRFVYVYFVRVLILLNIQSFKIITTMKNIKIHLNSRRGIYTVVSTSYPDITVKTKNSTFTTSAQDYKCLAGGKHNTLMDSKTIEDFLSLFSPGESKSYQSWWEEEGKYESDAWLTEEHAKYWKEQEQLDKDTIEAVQFFSGLSNDPEKAVRFYLKHFKNK